VRRDLKRLTAALGDDTFMHQIAAELSGFTKPALLAWADDDKFFPADDARRLAGILPETRIEPAEMLQRILNDPPPLHSTFPPEVPAQVRSVVIRGLLKSKWEDEAAAHAEGRPARRYFTLTASGATALKAALDRYKALRPIRGFAPEPS